jgi:hypothetical protein
VRKQLVGLGLSVLLGLAGGCSTLPKTPQSVDFHIQTQVLEAVPPDVTVEVWMSAVPGSIYGVYTDKRIVDLLVEGPRPFPVSLARLESGLARQAVVARTDSLRVAPAGTRIARLSTVGQLPHYSTRKFVAGLHEPSSGRELVLFYVDRPCVIRGIYAEHSGNPRPYELHVTHQGLNWLEQPEDGSAVEALRLVEPRSDLIYRLRESH